MSVLALPENWIFGSTEFVTGEVPTIVIPAVSGVSHVLTDINVTVVQDIVQTYQVLVNSGGGYMGVGGWLEMNPAAAGQNDVEVFTWTGSLPFTQGDFINVLFASALGAGAGCLMNISGYST